MSAGTGITLAGNGGTVTPDGAALHEASRTGGDGRGGAGCWHLS